MPKEQALYATAYVQAGTCKNEATTLQLIRDFENKLLGLLPAEARIGNGFTVCALLNLLVAVFNIALDHQALYYVAYLL